MNTIKMAGKKKVAEKSSQKKSAKKNQIAMQERKEMIKSLPLVSFRKRTVVRELEVVEICTAEANEFRRDISQISAREVKEFGHDLVDLPDVDLDELDTESAEEEERLTKNDCCHQSASYSFFIARQPILAKNLRIVDASELAGIPEFEEHEKLFFRNLLKINIDSNLDTQLMPELEELKNQLLGYMHKTDAEDESYPLCRKCHEPAVVIADGVCDKCYSNNLDEKGCCPGCVEEKPKEIEPIAEYIYQHYLMIEDEISASIQTAPRTAVRIVKHNHPAQMKGERIFKASRINNRLIEHITGKKLNKLDDKTKKNQLAKIQHELMPWSKPRKFDFKELRRTASERLRQIELDNKLYHDSTLTMSDVKVIAHIQKTEDMQYLISRHGLTEIEAAVAVGIM